MMQADNTNRQRTNFDERVPNCDERVPWSTTRRLRPRTPRAVPPTDPARPAALSAPADPADADAVEELGDRIAVLTAQISAATHQLLVLIAEFDQLRGWEAGGHRSCGHWLAFRTQVDLGTAREKVRAARALETLPQTSAAMARGELTFSQVRALTRVAEPANEADLLELARGATTAQLERMIRAYRLGSRHDEAQRERERFESRTFSIFPDDDGMYVVRGRVMPEVGALLMRTIEAASDALFRERRVVGEGSLKEAAQRRADALALVAERALAAGFGDAEPDGESTGAESTGAESTGAESTGAESTGAESTGAESTGAESTGAESTGTESTGTASNAAASRSAPISGTRAARYQVVLHVDAAALVADPDSEDGGGCPHVSRERSPHHDSSDLEDAPDVSRERSAQHDTPHVSRERSGRGEICRLEDGTRISHEAARRICCDASLVRVTRDASGGLLDIGRRTRTIPPALRRVLEIRDGGCRFPGCGLRFTDGHHVRHWIEGGETSLSNCLLLCSHHHRLMHEGGWRVEFWGRDVPVFIDPRGNQHCDGRPLSTKLPEQPAETLIREQLRRGIRAHAGSLGARWRSEAQVPDELWQRVSEAL
jgi:hypothetical protein